MQILTILFLILSSTSYAKIYKCTNDNGLIEYQERKCTEGKKSKEIEIDEIHKNENSDEIKAVQREKQLSMNIQKQMRKYREISRSRKEKKSEEKRKTKQELINID